MAWTKFDNQDEKKRLQARAEALKPKVAGVVATELGWAIVQQNGLMEVLVRYDGLDALLGDAVSEVEQVGEPLTVTPEVVIEEVVVEEPVTDEADTAELAVEPTAPKKPGRPKKVVSE